MPMISIHTPFGGFYESIHSTMLDSAVEQAVSDDHGDPMHPYLDELCDMMPWTYVRTEYAKAYITHMNSALPADADTPLIFDEVSSPREYNFTTDRIFCNISRQFMHRIAETLPTNPRLRVEFDTICNEWFASRSGFTSFYHPNWRAWYDDRDAWDSNQWSALFAAYWSHHVLDGVEQNSFEEDVACCLRANGVIDQCIERALCAYDTLHPSEAPSRSAQFNSIIAAADAYREDNEE